MGVIDKENLAVGLVSVINYKHLVVSLMSVVDPHELCGLNR